jgi:hypothetical protein
VLVLGEPLDLELALQGRRLEDDCRRHAPRRHAPAPLPFEERGLRLRAREAELPGVAGLAPGRRVAVEVAEPHRELRLG